MIGVDRSGNRCLYRLRLDKCVVDGFLVLGKSLVILLLCRLLALLLTVIDIEQDKESQQGRAFGLAKTGQKLFDSRRLPSDVGLLETVACIIDSVGHRSGSDRIIQAKSVVHFAVSLL